MPYHWQTAMQMPLPGSWITATYLYINKLKALNALLNSAEYTITRKREFLFPSLKICQDTATGALNVTITGQVVVYVPLQLRGQLNSFCFSSIPLSPLWLESSKISSEAAPSGYQFQTTSSLNPFNFFYLYLTDIN